MEDVAGAIDTPAQVDGDEVAPADDVTPSVPGAMMELLGDLVDAVAATDRMLAVLSASRAELIDQAREWAHVTEVAKGETKTGGWSAEVVAHRTVVSELACALRLPDRTVENLLAESQGLVHDLPATLTALREGEISYRHARTILDQARSLPAEARTGFEEAVLPAAKTQTVARLARKARIVRERTHPESLTERHRCSMADRHVRLEPDLDGMAWLNAYLPAEKALGIYDRVTKIAQGLKHPDEPRNLAQRRADVYDNLAHVCSPDHKLKHHTAWRVKQAGGGTLEWTSPTGRRYTSEPEVRIAESAISDNDPPPF